jgi:hypothetical protein
VLDRPSGLLVPCGSWTYAEAVNTSISTNDASAMGLATQQSGQQQLYVNRAGIIAVIGFAPQVWDRSAPLVSTYLHARCCFLLHTTYILTALACGVSPSRSLRTQGAPSKKHPASNPSAAASA